MSRRSRAREVALQILFEDDVNPRATVAEMKEFVGGRLNHQAELIEFCMSLILGVRRNQTELDEQLSQIADNWSVARMAATDRNVMRLGAYEILYTDTPDRAAINEAVELAKRFGSAQSAHFVNGILDKFIHRTDKGPGSNS
ncbi:MAG TPA: transcription antitermination factor NusB [Lacipirellulaceae bacterium]|jgi:N utilization substance protein B|nr:transcription antitermination factor NusB [Lacipirellulaceae bacterium]